MAVAQPTAICRDDRCKIVEVHPVHPIFTVRGRPPKWCALCGSAVNALRSCTKCHWHQGMPGKPKKVANRRRFPTMEHSKPWRACPVCGGRGCLPNNDKGGVTKCSGPCNGSGVTHTLLAYVCITKTTGGCYANR